MKAVENGRPERTSTVSVSVASILLITLQFLLFSGILELGLSAWSVSVSMCTLDVRCQKPFIASLSYLVWYLDMTRGCCSSF